MLVDPEPASAIYVEYSETADRQLRVRVFFNNDTLNFNNRKPLFIDQVEQAADGSMTAEAFNKFLNERIRYWDKGLFAIEGDVPTKCDHTFDAIYPSRTDFFSDPEVFRKALYKHFDVTPVDG